MMRGRAVLFFLVEQVEAALRLQLCELVAFPEALEIDEKVDDHARCANDELLSTIDRNE